MRMSGDVHLLEVVVRFQSDLSQPDRDCEEDERGGK